MNFMRRLFHRHQWWPVVIRQDCDHPVTWSWRGQRPPDAAYPPIEQRRSPYGLPIRHPSELYVDGTHCTATAFLECPCGARWSERWRKPTPRGWDL